MFFIIKHLVFIFLSVQKLKKGSYFYTGLMFIGFALMIFSIALYRYYEQSYSEYLKFGEVLSAEVVKIDEFDSKPTIYFLSIPFASLQYGSLDLVYAKPIIRYRKLNGMETAFVNEFPVTIGRELDSLNILYSPIRDDAIIYDTFYLQGWLWISSIISALLLILGVFCLRI